MSIELKVCGQNVETMQSLIQKIRECKAELIEMSLNQQKKRRARFTGSNAEEQGSK